MENLTPHCQTQGPRLIFNTSVPKWSILLSYLLICWYWSLLSGFYALYLLFIIVSSNHWKIKWILLHWPSTFLCCNTGSRTHSPLSVGSLFLIQLKNTRLVLCSCCLIWNTTLVFCSQSKSNETKVFLGPEHHINTLDCLWYCKLLILE